MQNEANSPLASRLTVRHHEAPVPSAPKEGAPTVLAALVLTILGIPCPTPAADDPKPLRVLLLVGGHDYDADSFHTLLEHIDGVESVTPMSSAQAFAHDRRDQFDVAVFYDFTRDLDPTAQRNLRDFVEAGRGVVVLHHALLNFQTWPWWADSVAGARYRLAPENGEPASSVKDAISMSIAPAPGAPHPALQGIEPFVLTDEGYRDLYRARSLQPLLVLSTPVDGSDDVVAWVGPCTTARVVATSLGHGPTAYRHPAYRRFVHNAIRWAGHRLD
jgi:type 1 glutamine amidotransferase